MTSTLQRLGYKNISQALQSLLCGLASHGYNEADSDFGYIQFDMPEMTVTITRLAAGQVISISACEGHFTRIAEDCKCAYTPRNGTVYKVEIVHQPMRYDTKYFLVDGPLLVPYGWIALYHDCIEILNNQDQFLSYLTRLINKPTSQISVDVKVAGDQ